jgi:hypothetical protein
MLLMIVGERNVVIHFYNITKEIYIICYYVVFGEGTSCIDQDYNPFKDAHHHSPL